MLKKFASALAMMQGASCQLTNYPGDIEANKVPSGEYDYYYDSPIYLFADSNIMRSVFPEEDGVTAGDPGKPWDDVARTTSETSAVWRIELRSLTNLDTGKRYIQLTNELEASILETDHIEFAIEFLNKEEDTSQDSSLSFRFDMMKCKVYADVFASGYWAQEAEDWNIRYDTTTTSNVYALDDAPTEALLGQDWFIY